MAACLTVVTSSVLLFLRYFHRHGQPFTRVPAA
jgi:hypothetical protein